MYPPSLLLLTLSSLLIPMYPNWTLTEPQYPHCTPLYSHCILPVPSMYPTVPQPNPHYILTVPQCTLTVSSLYPTVLSLYHHCILPVPSMYPPSLLLLALSSSLLIPLYPDWTLTVPQCTLTVSSLYPNVLSLYPHFILPVPSLYPPSTPTPHPLLLPPSSIMNLNYHDHCFTAIILVVERSIIVGSPVIVGWPWLYND